MRSLSDTERVAWLSELHREDPCAAANVRKIFNLGPPHVYGGLTTSEVAEVFGVGIEAIQMWTRKGCPLLREADENSKVLVRLYDVSSVAKWLVERKTNLFEPDNSEDARRKAAIQEEDLRLRELKRKKLEGELIETRYLQARCVQLAADARRGVDRIQRAYGDDVAADVSRLFEELVEGLERTPENDCGDE